MAELTIGTRIPNFRAKDQDGLEITEEDIAGGLVVIYFYPKDRSPLCTREACFFQESLEKFIGLDAVVLGISPDIEDSHKKFAKEHHLEFALLSDEKKAMCQKFGVLKKNGKVERTTFVIDEDGFIRWMEKPVQIEGHIERVLKALETHCPIKKIEEEEIDQTYRKFLEEKEP